MGDSVDNVPGVPGIGPKTAAQLIGEFGDLEGVLAAAPRDEARQAPRPADRACRRRPPVPPPSSSCAPTRRFPAPVAELGVTEPHRETLSAWLEAMGFRSIATRLGYEPGAVPEDSVPAAAAAPKEDVAFGPYETVTTTEALQAWAAEAFRIGVVAVEAQADGADPMRAHLVGVSLAVGHGRACYVPLRHEELGVQLRFSDVVAALGPVLADSSVQKVFHDAKRAMMLLDGVAIAPADDVMLMSYSLAAGAHDHGLEELSRLHLAYDPPSLDAVTGTGRARLTLAQAPIERAAAFAAARADATWRLWDALRPRLRTGGALNLYERMERRLTPVLLAMERAGVRVDEADLRRMSADFEQRMAAIEAECHVMAGRPFNLGSPKALGEVLFDEMKLPGGRRMKTGAWGTDASVLTSLAEQGADLPARILDWRQLSKLKSTYADALVGEINPATGRVHTRFAMAVASTGRLSSTEPNLQNIPIRTEEGSRIRRAFVAEPGHLLVSCDYSQIELRLLACVADIPVLTDSFRNDEDIHAPHRERGVRRADGADGPDDAAARQGDQLRHHLRHQRVRPGPPARHLAGRGEVLHRRVLRPVSRHPRLHGARQGGGSDRRLRHHAVRPALLGAGDRGQEPGQARLRGAPGRQRAAARGRGRRHQARDGEAAGGARGGRPALPPAAAGARRAAVRGPRGRGRGARRRRQTRDGGCGQPFRAPGGGDGGGADLGGGALTAASPPPLPTSRERGACRRSALAPSHLTRAPLRRPSST